MKKETVAICGLGYVGYPVAMLFADADFNVIGVDILEDRVKRLNAGENPIKGQEPGLDELVEKVFKVGNFRATSDMSEYGSANYIVVAVQTPVAEENKKPTYENLKGALKGIGQNMKEGVTIIIESTIAPGTMEHVVKPILEKESGLEAGEGFYLANCPERLMPGHLLENIRYYNRVVGGWTPESAEIVKKLYKNFVEGELQETDCITAEIVKAGENTYRDVQIAFANEMALLCEAYGANVWKVREFINNCKKVTETRPEALRQMHFPGAGVGGHCIPKDSWLLIHEVRDIVNPKLIPTARYINDFMPLHMYDLLKDGVKEAGKELKDMNILVLGYAYDANSDDDRNTPTVPLMGKLKENGIKFEIQDPFINDYQGDIESMLKGKDAIVVMTGHDQYKELSYEKMLKLMGKKPLIIDGRNIFNKEEAREKGFIYKGVGNI
ncbi:MAG: NDP-N-acetyl-D-galactosaminuronic acid dehydrogenase [Candidatus Moranbacteria bacterium GW2011_GWD2_37_9]|uniref:NDP-N-acetyl-D-galactosaminuronic acid dehydrogenase n=1 Tax=Candidatus Nomurabacteria bacterium GW2011_GWE1_35_16 TaxID=1618761 RepID=A0A0G0EF76_9BACT|nr:MAG: NDP-N-acetyl-D-galactosaminuronic acid dehydrogenase [Candidatus Nomurabacteria bacterium GW2011_GWE1_35_16]KKQ47586.1 MAG: NDP-N-acetyl-D-galactosaminuronic acid dehydrogenase [Candidatus Moranbacteria bacterium GW2011_GWD2_37_9]